MKALGLKDVHVDEIGNVIGRRPGRGDGPVLAIGAHMDTVFPEGTPIKVRREGDRYWAPGIADNCCGLRCLLETIRAFEETGVETEGDIWFVGTVGEEGNGDIRGSKHLFNGTNHIDGFLAVTWGVCFTPPSAAIATASRSRVRAATPGRTSRNARARSTPCALRARRSRT